jgi:hypothetical protein
MSIESQLREKLRKIEALFAGAGTAGERLAAEAALERVRARLAELGGRDAAIEMQFSMPDRWSRHLFLALCRRYGLAPYRYHRQRRNTVMVRAPKGFINEVLWPEFRHFWRHRPFPGDRDRPLPRPRRQKPRRVKGYSERARKPDSRGTAWWRTHSTATGLHPEFPDNREINREFFDFGRFYAVLVSNRRANSAGYNKIPYATEQGIFLA